MLTIHQPTESEIVRYLIASRQEPFSYESVGVTRSNDCPVGFNRDSESTLLGHGREVFEQARKSLAQWAMFPREMTTLYWPDRPIEIGTTVAVQFRVGPFWSLNPCRIVYTLDERPHDLTPAQFGFAYGTLPGHLECGEELFLIRWDPADDSVRYELVAVSKPNHVLAQLGYPITRREQARFRRLSASAMQQAVASPNELLC
jgi:uncharacterized protein (UPF0548 family)